MKIYRAGFISISILLLAQSCSLFSPFGGGTSTVGGVAKSVDAAETWERVGRVGEEGQYRANTTHVLLEPETDTLYTASTNQGVFVSQDRSGAFRQLLSGAVVAQLAQRPQIPSELLAAGSVDNLAKIFNATDSGQAWIEIYSESRPDNFVAAVNYTPAGETILAGLSTGEVLESSNGGVSWDLLSRLPGRLLKIFINPNNRRDVYALEFKEGLHRSTDGGRTWTNLSANLPSSSTKYLDFAPFVGNSSSFYLATTIGLFRTSSAGATWQRLQLPSRERGSKDANLGTTVSAVAVSPGNNNELFATVGTTLYKSTDAGATWQTHLLPAGASVRQLVIDSEEPNIIYAALGQPLQ